MECSGATRTLCRPEVLASPCVVCLRISHSSRHSVTLHTPSQMASGSSFSLLWARTFLSRKKKKNMHTPCFDRYAHSLVWQSCSRNNVENEFLLFFPFFFLFFFLFYLQRVLLLVAFAFLGAVAVIQEDDGMEKHLHDVFAYPELCKSFLFPSVLGEGI